MVNLTGTFTTTRGKEAADFFQKVGLPGAEKFEGTKWYLKVGKSGDVWTVYMKCLDIPELVVFDTWILGKEKCVDRSPALGGKTKMFAKQTSDNTFSCYMESEVYGRSEWTEEWTDAGVYFDYVHKKTGTQYKEFMRREVDITGTFVFDKQEGWDEYHKVTKSPFPMDPSYKSRVEKCGEMLKITEFYQGSCFTEAYKVDEEKEIDYMGQKVIVLLSQFGPSTFHMIAKYPATGTEEYIQTADDNGCKIVCKHPSKGVSCTVWLKRVHDFSGTYKVVTHHGNKQLFELMGLKPDVTAKLLNDPDTRTIITEEGNCLRYQYVSKIMPCDVFNKFDEEFEYSDPNFPQLGNAKIICTKIGNTLVTISKTAFGTTKDTHKITPHYLIQTTEMVGQPDLCWKTIWERC